MEAIHQARTLYRKANYHQESLTDSDKRQLELDIQRFIMIGIKEVPAKDIFHHSWILDILKSALKQKANDNSDVLPIARAFESLEQYFLLLVEHPWKPEFKEIKMYGGYYRTRIKAVLPNCESIFEHAGYVIHADKSVLRYKGPMDEKSLLLLAFDCKVALVECKTIAEHYNKIKSMAMTLSDAVDMILHDEWSRDKSSLSRSPNWGNGLILNKADHSSIQAPPAIPKRQPILNGSTMKQNLNPNSEAMYPRIPSSAKYEVSNLDVSDKKFKDYPSKSLQQPVGNMYSPTVKSPLASSDMEAFMYIDAQENEILREFPRGTKDEHMRESLKFVNQQEGSKQPTPVTSYSASLKGGIPMPDDWKWLPNYRNNGNIMPGYQMEVANVPVPRTALGGCGANSFMQSNEFIDEGIVMDMSAIHLQRPMLSQHLQNRPTQSIAALSDQGYRTATLSDNPCSRGPSQGMVPTPTIYHPPATANLESSVSDKYQLNTMPRTSMGPPPVPSRALKPKLRRTGEDEMDGQLIPALNQPVTGHPANICPRNTIGSDGNVVGQPASASNLPPPIPFSDSGPVLRRDRLTVGKSKSLKYEATPESMRQQAIAARAARSMDMTLTTWECKACTAVNMASDLTCSVCTHSRHGPDTSSPSYGKTKKSCLQCTFENDSVRENCEMCGLKLENSYSYV